MKDSVEARELLYEGKAKKLFATDDPDLLLQYFKDEATAFNARFRRDLGRVEEACQEIARRVGA